MITFRWILVPAFSFLLTILRKMLDNLCNYCMYIRRGLLCMLGGACYYVILGGGACLYVILGGARGRGPFIYLLGGACLVCCILGSSLSFVLTILSLNCCRFFGNKRRARLDCIESTVDFHT